MTYSLVDLIQKSKAALGDDLVGVEKRDFGYSLDVTLVLTYSFVASNSCPLSVSNPFPPSNATLLA
eukprot:1366262-Amorphochlora_amoeboformis.AAC.1